MADEQTTTEVADNPVTEQNSESVLGSGISDNQTQTDWKSSLPEELRNEPTLQNLNDVESLAKTVVHQQKMIGNRIPLPKNDEEKAELYNKLGRPDDPANYEFEIPETHKPYFAEPSVNEFKNVAHQIGLNNDQVKQLLNGPAGNDPAIVKLFARLGGEVTEEMAKNTQNNKLSVSPLDAKQEIEQIMTDTKGPYFDASHKDHLATVEKMRQLHEKAFGNS